MAETDADMMAFEAHRAGVLSKLIRLFSQGMEPTALAEEAVHLVAEATDARGVFVYLWDEDEERLILKVASKGRQSTAVDEVRLRLGEGIAGWAALHRQKVNIRSAPRDDPRFKYVAPVPEDEFHSMLAVPIADEGDSLRGVFALYSEAEDAFGVGESDIAVEVGCLLAVGLVHAETVSELSLQSQNARFLLDFPVGSTTSLVPALNYAASRIVDLCAVDFFAIDYMSKDDRTNLPVTFAARGENGGDHRVWSTHSRTSVQRVLEQHGAGLESTTVSLGMTSLRGVMTLYRRAPFRARDLNQVNAVAAQLSVILEAVDLTAVNSSQTMELFYGRSQMRATALLEDLRTQEPLWPIVLRFLEVPDNWDVGRRRLKELLTQAVGPRAVVLFDSISGVMLVESDLVAQSRDLKAKINEVLRQLSGEFESRVAVGIGPLVESRVKFRSEMEKAKKTLNWAVVANRRSQNPVACFDDIERVIALPTIWSELTDDVTSLCDSLEPLADYDGSHGTQLLKTLSTFSRCGGQVHHTASQLVVHRNTLRQRLQRIEQLLGRDMTTTTDWVSLAIAARVVESRLENG
ncbi:helix-turn-helix domain-containing protein [Brevibacterium sp. 'Marine']|uniref:helix-turn-helix domain-containing protein n=1 Tax=Brevibacterium sp. 'Marine' TaxID=2725563 RepID=UPI00145E179E|nr:helix-turn-helix domain-containing protein [Brevibacterium sp. 'Marine']